MPVAQADRRLMQNGLVELAGERDADSVIEASPNRDLATEMAGLHRELTAWFAGVDSHFGMYAAGTYPRTGVPAGTDSIVGVDRGVCGGARRAASPVAQR